MNALGAEVQVVSRSLVDQLVQQFVDLVLAEIVFQRAQHLFVEHRRCRARRGRSRRPRPRPRLPPLLPQFPLPGLWSRRFGPDQTEWAISLWPLGGYVKMLDQRDADLPALSMNQNTPYV